MGVVKGFNTWPKEWVAGIPGLIWVQCSFPVFSKSVAITHSEWMSVTREHIGLSPTSKNYTSANAWRHLHHRTCHGWHALRYFLTLPLLSRLYAIPCPWTWEETPGVLTVVGERHMETNLGVTASLLLDHSVGSETLQNPLVQAEGC